MLDELHSLRVPFTQTKKKGNIVFDNTCINGFKRLMKHNFLMHIVVKIGGYMKSAITI